MTEMSFHDHAFVNAPPETVYAVLSDHTCWSASGDWEKISLATPGHPEPEGVGSVWDLCLKNHWVVQHLVNLHFPPRVFGYTQVGDEPAKEHQGVVVLTPNGGGTDLDWYMTTSPNTSWADRRDDFRQACARGVRDLIEVATREAELRHTRHRTGVTA